MLQFCYKIMSNIEMNLVDPNILGCAMYGWASWTRRSFGMLANYLLLVTIDSIGLMRMIL